MASCSSWKLAGDGQGHPRICRSAHNISSHQIKKRFGGHRHSLARLLFFFKFKFQIFFFSNLNFRFLNFRIFETGCIFRCEAALGEFLRGISKSPNKVNYSAMVNVLIAHCHSSGKKTLIQSRTEIESPGSLKVQNPALCQKQYYLQLPQRLPFLPGVTKSILRII